MHRNFYKAIHQRCEHRKERKETSGREDTEGYDLAAYDSIHGNEYNLEQIRFLDPRSRDAQRSDNEMRITLRIVNAPHHRMYVASKLQWPSDRRVNLFPSLYARFRLVPLLQPAEPPENQQQPQQRSGDRLGRWIPQVLSHVTRKLPIRALSIYSSRASHLCAMLRGEDGSVRRNARG